MTWFCPDCDFMTKDKSKLINSHLAIYHAYLDKFYYQDEEKATTPSRHGDNVDMETSSQEDMDMTNSSELIESRGETNAVNDVSENSDINRDASEEVDSTFSSNDPSEEMDTSIPQESNLPFESPRTRKRHQTRVLATNWKHSYECSLCQAVVPSLLKHFLCHIFLQEFKCKEVEEIRPRELFSRDKWRYY